MRCDSIVLFFSGRLALKALVTSTTLSTRRDRQSVWTSGASLRKLANAKCKQHASHVLFCTALCSRQKPSGSRVNGGNKRPHFPSQNYSNNKANSLFNMIFSTSRKLKWMSERRGDVYPHIIIQTVNFSRSLPFSSFIVLGDKRKLTEKHPISARRSQAFKTRVESVQFY